MKSLPCSDEIAAAVGGFHFIGSLSFRFHPSVAEDFIALRAISLKTMGNYNIIAQHTPQAYFTKPAVDLFRCVMSAWDITQKLPPF